MPSTAGADAARITQIARVTAELAAARDTDTVTEIVVTHAAAALDARVAALSLRRADELVLVGLSGVAPEMEGRWTVFRIDAQLPASEAVRTGQPIVVDRARRDRGTVPVAGRHDPRARALDDLPTAHRR